MQCQLDGFDSPSGETEVRAKRLLKPLQPQRVLTPLSACQNVRYRTHSTLLEAHLESPQYFTTSTQSFDTLFTVVAFVRCPVPNSGETKLLLPAATTQTRLIVIMPLTQSPLPVKIPVLEKTHHPRFRRSRTLLCLEPLRCTSTNTLGFDRSYTVEPHAILNPASFRRLDTALSLIALALVLKPGLDFPHTLFEHLTCPACTNNNSVL